MNGTTVAIGLVILGAILLVLGVLYGLGDFELFTRTGHGPQYKHALLLVILAVLSLIAANFARRRPA